MKILVGMSGGVDSSVAALILKQQGHEVIGATMKLWGGSTTSGCCSLRDVDDARRIARSIGIDHYVLNFTNEFQQAVVDPYIFAHQNGLTPNPCVECNRSVKFPDFISRALSLGFDAVATGHFARIEKLDELYSLKRGVDRKKDQSYVLHTFNQNILKRVIFPLGDLTKTEVRQIAEEHAMTTAAKPDSQDVCFIDKDAGGRSEFLGKKIPLHVGRLRDVTSGESLGEIEDIELITIGQRKGMGGGTAQRRFAVNVDIKEQTVDVGNLEDLMVDQIYFERVTFVGGAIEDDTIVELQCSAHGPTHFGIYHTDRIQLKEPIRKVAPGQSVVFYSGDTVLGGAICSTTQKS